MTGGKADGDRTTEAATARAYAIAHGVPADGDPRRGREPDDARVDPWRSARSSATHGLADAVFVSDRPHMLRVLRMATDQGITAWGSPTTTSPIEHDPPASRRDAPRARRAGPVLPGRRGRPEPVPQTGPISVRRSGFPSWREGFGPVYCAKTPPDRGPPRPPGTTIVRSPIRPCPAQREGAREAGRGSVVRRSDRLRA